jgi:hypothetical protein
MALVNSDREEFYKRRENKIRNLFKKGYSKNGVFDRLRKLNLRCLDIGFNEEDDAIAASQIDSVFSELLSSGLYNVGFNKGKNKSEFLFLKK